MTYQSRLPLLSSHLHRLQTHSPSPEHLILSRSTLNTNFMSHSLSLHFQIWLLLPPSYFPHLDIKNNCLTTRSTLPQIQTWLTYLFEYRFTFVQPKKKEFFYRSTSTTLLKSAKIKRRKVLKFFAKNISIRLETRVVDYNNNISPTVSKTHSPHPSPSRLP